MQAAAAPKVSLDTTLIRDAAFGASSTQVLQTSLSTMSGSHSAPWSAGAAWTQRRRA